MKVFLLGMADLAMLGLDALPGGDPPAASGVRVVR